MSISATTQEALWLQQLQRELGQHDDNTLSIYCDNQSAIRLSTNDCYLPRSKHIDIRYHFLKHHVSNSELKFHYIEGKENISDIFFFFFNKKATLQLFF